MNLGHNGMDGLTTAIFKIMDNGVVPLVLIVLILSFL